MLFFFEMISNFNDLGDSLFSDPIFRVHMALLSRGGAAVPRVQSQLPRLLLADLPALFEQDCLSTLSTERLPPIQITHGSNSLDFIYVQ